MTAFESSFGVGIANRFMLLEEESDEQLDEIQNDGDTEIVKNRKPIVSKSGFKEDNIPISNLNLENKVKQNISDKTTIRKDDIKRYKPNERIQEQNDRQKNMSSINGEKPPQSFEDAKSLGMGRGRPVSNMRGGLGRDVRANKREFDRHSGSDKTGVKPVDKKDGAGSHNWGSIQDTWGNSNDFTESPNNTIDKTEIEDPWSKPEENPDKINFGIDEVHLSKFDDTQDYINKSIHEPDAEDTPEAIQEPEVIHMTLDEWKALQEKEIVKPEYKLRQPGEGEDKSKWKGTYVYKPAENIQLNEIDEENKAHHSNNSTKVGKKLLDINIKYTSHYNSSRGGNFGANRPPFQRPMNQQNGPATNSSEAGGSGFKRGGGAPFNRGGSRGRGGNRGGFDSGNRGGFDNGNRGGFDNGNRGGFDNGNRGGFDNGNRGGFNSGNRGGFNRPSGPNNFGRRNDFPRNNPDGSRNEPLFNDESDFPSLRTVTAK
ncbi:unnamed protein product [Gordionus sp. m RMFG-2023]|uniref:intracellular hyaluronan-binding protein 4.S-like n=1 Tax=Gordionus sp. m RMFG-2023 TaxID=3053472 RepID=UPI0030E1A9CE